MGVRIGSSSNANIVAAAVVTTAETIIAQTGPIGQAVDNAQVLVFAYALITPGTAATAITVRLRRGTTVASPAINIPVAVGVAAGAPFILNLSYVDSPGVAAGLQYSLSVQFTSATGNSTINDVSISGIVL